jgi:hypothetical protein
MDGTRTMDDGIEDEGDGDNWREEKEIYGGKIRRAGRYCQYDDSTLLKQQKGVSRRSELSRDYSTYTTCDTPPQFVPQA